MNSTKSQLLKLPQSDYFDSFSVVKQEVDDALYSHANLYRIYDKHEKYFNGEVTMSIEARKKLGLGWLECWNYGKAMNKIRQIVIGNQRTMLDSLFLSVPVFRSFKTSDASKKHMYYLADKKLSAEVGDHITSALSIAFEADGRTNQFIMEVEYPALVFGYSAVLKREDDWLPEVLHPRHIAFPKNTSPDDCRRWVVFSEIRAEELYEIWTQKLKEKAEYDEDAQTGAEYKIAGSYVLEGIEEALWNAFQDKYVAGKSSPNQQYKTWQDVVDTFSTRGQYIIQNTMDVKIAKLFNRELDGTLSETWIQYDREQYSVEASSKLLFKKTHGKITQDQALTLIKDSGFTDDGKIAKLRGISKMAVEDGLRYDQARNMVMNKAKMIGMPYIQTSGVNSNVANSIEVTQGFGVLKQGTSFVDNQPSFDLSSHINLLNFQEAEYRQFSKDYDPSIEGKLSNRPTKNEVSIVSGEAASMEMAKASVKLSDYTKVIKMMLHGLCSASPTKGSQGYESQRIFFDKLIDKLTAYGIDNKAKCIDVIESIEYMPMAYYGMSLDVLRTMMSMAETPASRNRIYRMMLLRMGVPRNEIEYHAPYEESGYRSLEDEALVAIENNMFLTTTDVVYSDSHDPISHLDGHFAKIQEIFQGVGEGSLDSAQGYKWAANIAEHNKLHLNALASNPFYQNRASQYNKGQSNLLENLVRLRMMAQQEAEQRAQMEQQAQEAQGGIDPVQAAKIRELEFKAQSKAQRDQFLTNVRMETRKEQQAFNNALRMQDQEFSQKLKEQQATNDAKLKLIESATKQIT